MPKYIIERDIAGAGKLTAEELMAISQKSCAVLRELGPSIQWIHSYVTDDRIYCIYLAPDEQMLLQHARQGGFPADVIARVHRMIEPVTAEGVAAAG
jgi:Nickel responsive protein SCO4226-like